MGAEGGCLVVWVEWGRGVEGREGERVGREEVSEGGDWNGAVEKRRGTA